MTQQLVPDPCSRSEQPKTGTTIVACCYANGVVIGADSRVSTGTYVSNRASDKTTPLSDNVWLLRSGSAADTQLVSDYVRWFTSQHAMELQSQPTVRTVANLVKQMNYQNKEMLVGALIVAGYDEEQGGQIYGIPIGGSMVQQKWATDGSGSTYIWGYMDSSFRDDFTREEAEDFVVTSLTLAMARDGSSGGVVRTVTINADGVDKRFVPCKQLALQWDEHASTYRGMVV